MLIICQALLLALNITMTEFTHNNHLKYWIGDRPWGWRESPFEEYRVDIGTIDPQQYNSGTWYTEQLRIAELVTAQFGPQYALFYSGGTDSEIVLRMLLRIGSKPQVFFIRFADDYNVGDYRTAVQVTEQLGVRLNVIETDIIDFYRSGCAAELGGTIQCHQIAYINVLHHIKRLGLPAIMGGEIYLKRRPVEDGSQWYYNFRENEDAAAMRFSIKYGIPLVNEWFSYTPEAVAHTINHPLMQSLVTERFNYKVSSVSSKNNMLVDVLPELSGVTKSHGFERLLNFNTETYYKLAQTHTKRLSGCLDGIPLDRLKSKLLGGVA